MRLVMDRCKDANQLTDKRAFCNDGDDAPACSEESRAEGGRTYFIGRRLSWRMDSIWLAIPQNRSLEWKAMNMFIDVLLATNVFAFAPALRGQACQRWLKSDLMISNSCREITNSRLDGAVSAKMNRRTGCVTAVSCRATASFDLTSGMRGLRHPSTMTHGSPIVSKRPGAHGNANGHYALRQSED